jgi:tight adherence protein C
MEMILAVLSLFLCLMFLGIGLYQMSYNQGQAKAGLKERFETFKARTGTVSRHKVMQQSFSERAIIPLAQQVYENIQKYVPTSSQSWMRSKLVHAGYQKPHYLRTFIGIQCLLSVTMFMAFLTYSLLVTDLNLALILTISCFFGGLGFMFPLLWLIQQAGKRKLQIERSLPDFLDLLVICVEAGMALDVAFNKISELKIKKQMKELQYELSLYLKDVGLGKPRKDALLDLTTRTGVEDLNTLVTALAQSYEMGTSVSQVLRVHSESLRLKRLERAKEKANKIPVKMILPIYIFLFPAIFLAIFGPIGMVLIRTVMSLLSETKIVM